MRVLLVAEEAAGVQMLRAIAQGGYEVVAVMTAGANRPERTSPVRDAALELGYPCWPAERVREAGFAEQIRAAAVDVLVNVHSLFLISGDVLSAPRLGSFNMHPGPLPEYAGLNAVSWALYHGEARHGVTIHWMVPEVDAGAIAFQESFDIGEQDSALTLSVHCVRAGVPLMAQLLEIAARDPGALPATPQERARRHYYGRGAPQGGRLAWSRPARDVVNFVRACDYLPFRSPWGHPTGRLGDRELAVVKATRTGEPCAAPPGTVGDVVRRAVAVAAADEWVLVHRVLGNGSGEFCDARDWLRPGQRFADENGV